MSGRVDVAGRNPSGHHHALKLRGLEVKDVPNFRYRALTQTGEIVHGTLSAPSAREVAARIEYLRLLPIEREL